MWNQSESNILIVGHRGIRAFYPENTMISFEKAIEAGVDGIEMDINMTKDGHLVVVHDNSVDRTTNGFGLVQDMTLAELKRLDAGSYYSQEFSNEKIPTFEEFLDFVKDKNILLNVEIKDYRLSVVDKTIKMLNDYNLSDSYVLACFNAAVTTYAHKEYRVKTQGFPEWLVKNYQEDTDSHYYAVGIAMKDLTRDLCDNYKEMNIDPWCWCPDDEEGIYKAIDCGSTVVTVNNPFPAIKIIKEKS
ncbi:MAG TPA: glycerophosphodiester phosphodiesterase family protein [Mobilitalea sp.]|nr:glycerophosphodiester phosphodiesterase family protein [Mobilitalea sp.]